MTRRLLVSAALGGITAALFFAGFLLIAAPGYRITAAVLRRIEDNHKTSSKGEVA